MPSPLPPRACDRCWKLKSQCDGAKPCSRCTRLEIRCVTDRPARRKGRPRKANSSTKTHARTSTREREGAQPQELGSTDDLIPAESSQCLVGTEPLWRGNETATIEVASRSIGASVVEHESPSLRQCTNPAISEGGELVSSPRGILGANQTTSGSVLSHTPVLNEKSPSFEITTPETPDDGTESDVLYHLPESIHQLGLDHETASEILRRKFFVTADRGVFGVLQDLNVSAGLSPSSAGELDYSGYPSELIYILLSIALELEDMPLPSSVRRNKELLIDTLRIGSMRRIPRLTWKSRKMNLSQPMALVLASYTWALKKGLVDIATRWNSLARIIWAELHLEDVSYQAEGELVKLWTGAMIRVQDA